MKIAINVNILPGTEYSGYNTLYNWDYPVLPSVGHVFYNVLPFFEDEVQGYMKKDFVKTLPNPLNLNFDDLAKDFSVYDLLSQMGPDVQFVVKEIRWNSDRVDWFPYLDLEIQLV